MGIKFRYKDCMILFEEDNINVMNRERLLVQYAVKAFTRSPSAVFRRLLKYIKQYDNTTEDTTEIAPKVPE